MNDLPSRERIAEAVTFAHITDSDGDLLQHIGTAYVEGRLVDRGVLEPCHVRRTLHQTDYPCNRQQHYWIPDDS